MCIKTYQVCNFRKNLLYKMIIQFQVFWLNQTFSIIKNCWERIDGQRQSTHVMPSQLSQLWLILLTLKLFRGFRVITLCRFELFLKSIIESTQFLHISLPLFINSIDIKVGAWMRNERVNVGQSQSKALCLPFFSILLAMGNPTVDYFSLDV